MGDLIHASSYVLGNTMLSSDSYTEDAQVHANPMHDLLGCTYAYGYGHHNVCEGVRCYKDSMCAHDCCVSGYCNDYWCDDNYDLGWLWWSLAGFFIFLMLISMIAAAQRRRRQRAFLAAVHEQNRHNSNHCDTTAILYVQPNQQVPQGQPVMGQPMPAQGYPNQPMMYYQGQPGQHGQPV